MNNILKQIKLLYVEDDDSIRDILAKGIKRRVKELAVAPDGLEGLEKYKSFNPDIIVSDIKMPKMSGLEMAKEIRKIDSTIPIIITSAHGESETLIEAIKIGVNGYILKPIDTEKLFETIAFYAKTKVLEDELKHKNKQLALQSKNAALGEMISNIAHQWRQPLTVISTAASTIKLNQELNIIDKEATSNYLDNIIDTTQNLSKTIDYFRDILVSNSDQKELFSIKSLIENVIINLKDKIQSQNIQIINNFDDSLNIYGYPNLLLQSLINIFTNSIDAFESLDCKKYIFVDAKIDKNNNFYISIKDNAQGIDKNIIDNIFDPYVTTKHKSIGKGLGLHTTLEMIQNGMNGTIEVENNDFEYNKQRHKGTLFSIKLENKKN